jgi:CheY-like chemotaxis protein
MVQNVRPENPAGPATAVKPWPFQGEKRRKIDCVLLDLTMPHMDVEEAFKAMRAIRPDARIIDILRLQRADISERFTLDAKVTFIQ